MSNVFNNVNIDDTDPKYLKLKSTFTEEIKSKFSCDDYEPIVKYLEFLTLVSSSNTYSNLRTQKKILSMR